ncbi:hypothetical protein EG328_001835 [Venturia inaequalis]|uniref:Uncharacterized protein n=1 Tax=Venturia inaequalis TaxID=5025 RepID=A0A8H3YIN5_VENIN|nr:hypothetical protein EG328_001835 [Venturia inaequalis]
MDPKEFSTRTDITIATEDLDFDPEDVQEDLHNVDALPLEAGVVDTPIRILLDVISFQAAPGSSNSSKKVLATYVGNRIVGLRIILLKKEKLVSINSEPLSQLATLQKT